MTQNGKLNMKLNNAVASAKTLETSTKAPEKEPTLDEKVSDINIHADYEFTLQTEFRTYRINCYESVLGRRWRCDCHDSKCTHIDYIEKEWNDGKLWIVRNPKADEALTLIKRIGH